MSSKSKSKVQQMCIWTFKLFSVPNKQKLMPPNSNFSQYLCTACLLFQKSILFKRWLLAQPKQWRLLVFHNLAAIHLEDNEKNWLSLTQPESLIKFEKLQTRKCVGITYFLMEIITILSNISHSLRSEFLFPVSTKPRTCYAES